MKTPVTVYRCTCERCGFEWIRGVLGMDDSDHEVRKASHEVDRADARFGREERQALEGWERCRQCAGKHR
jgi:hypothetical protein